MRSGAHVWKRVRGLAQYMVKLESYAQQELGVQLSVNPKAAREFDKGRV